jgi:hypothetical protein
MMLKGFFYRSNPSKIEPFKYLFSSDEEVLRFICGRLFGGRAKDGGEAAQQTGG